MCDIALGHRSLDLRASLAQTAPLTGELIVAAPMPQPERRLVP